MIKLTLFVIIFAIIALPVLAFWSGTVQDQIISQDDNMLGWYTQSAVDVNGTIHTVWNERLVNYPTQQEIHYSRSSDNGHNWSSINQDVIISFNDGVNAENGSSIATDSDGYLYVVWSEDEGGYDEVHYSISHDGGNTWSGQSADRILSLAGGPYNALNPWMVVDGNDVLHVVWNQVYPQTGYGEIYYSRSTDGGLTWSSQMTERIISYPDGGNSLEPRIAVDGNDNLYVVWKEPSDSISTRGVINVSKSTDGGNTWTGTIADYPVTASFRIILYPAMTADANGFVHVVWKGTQDTVSTFHYEVYYSRSTDGGTNWSGLTQQQMVSYYPPGDPSSNIPNVGADHIGNVIVVWDEEYDFGRNEIMVSTSTNGGVTWSGTTQDEIISFPDAYPGYRPFVVAGLDDTLHVCWNEGTTSTGYYQIHYSRGDALGTIPILSVGVTPINPPIVIPANGGSFNFTASALRAVGPQAPFTVWTRIKNPDGTYTNPTIGPININPPVGLTITRGRTQNVPGSWAPGVYTYLGYGNTSYAYPVIDSDSFTFTKSTTVDGGPFVTEANCYGEPFPGEESVYSQPSGFGLLQASPNPFNPTTAISYQLSANSYVSLKIYDTAGRLAATIVDGWRETGIHEVTFDGSKLASGIYLAKLEVGEFTAVQKMVLLK